MENIKDEWFRQVWRTKKMIREAVKIPKTLIEKLSPFGPRFIKVNRAIPGDRKSGKNAVEHRFQKHPYEAEQLEEWLEQGGNYGVLFGEGLIGIDIDDPETYRKFEAVVQTFTVQSGRGPKGKHPYVRSNVTENGIILAFPNQQGERKNLGNIQAKNKYVVGPDSIHYTGKRYKIIKDIAFAWVNKERLEEIFGEQLVWTGERLRKDVAEQAQEESKLVGLEIPIDQIVDFSELRQISPEEWQGTHPIHGSTTGQNFCVNKVKNCWHCFRCNSGGGPLSWLAVKNGLIKCHQAQKGALKGELFLKTIELAQYEGFDVKLEKERYEILPLEIAKYFEAAKFIPSLLAEELMDKHHYLTRKDDKNIFIYHSEKGIYTSDGEAQIMTEVKKALGKHFRRNRQTEVLADIISSTLTDIKETPPHLIALKNGIFNLKTEKLEEFSSEHFILNALPVKYNSKVDCPRIKKFISEVIDKEDIPVLQEIAGYCLYRDYPIHVAVMFIGEGANGKSTFMTVLVSMLGLKNISTLPLQILDQRFNIAVLHGKLANICPDLSAQGLRKTGLFKSLTGNDFVSAEHKFKGRFAFRNYAKMIFSANQIPESKDDTTAFFRRWIIINYPNQFLPDNPKTDKDLTKKLTTEHELSGFFNWALEGLKRLLQNGRFSTGKSIEETREQYIRMSDPIKAFVMDRVRKQTGSNPLKNDVYRIYILYCKEKRLPTTAKNAFSMKLTEYIPGISEARRRVAGKIVKYWKDIAVSEEDIEEIERQPDKSNEDDRLRYFL